MAKRQANHTSRTYQMGKRSYPVVERLRIGRRVYLLLEQVGNANRKRYLAVDPSAGPGGEKRAVLKLPRSPAASQHIAAIKRASAHNANVPRLFDYLAGDSELILVMDWVEGVTLDELLAEMRTGKRTRPSPYEAVRLVRGLAHGLSRLHYKRQIIHGDIKPANLVLSQNSATLVAIDYGSAWLTERTATRDEGDGRSAAYAAPEQQSGLSFVDFRADQFAASVVLYELLTLELPYDQLGGKAGRSEYRAEMEDSLVPPSHFIRRQWKLPQATWRLIDGTVSQGLSPDPGQRHKTPSQWLAALDTTFIALKEPDTFSPLNAALTRVVDAIAGILEGYSKRP